MIVEGFGVRGFPVVQHLAEPLAASGLETLHELCAFSTDRDHAGPAVLGVGHLVEQSMGHQPRHLPAHRRDVRVDTCSPDGQAPRVVAQCEQARGRPGLVCGGQLGGVLALVLGLSVGRLEGDVGWTLVGGGGLVAVVGFVLIYIRSKIKVDS